MPPSEASAPGSIGKNSPLVAQVLVQLLAGHARLDDAVEVLLMHRDDPLHQARVDGDAAERRVDMALERRAGPERDDRDPMVRAQAHDLGDFLCRLAERRRCPEAGSPPRSAYGHAARAQPSRSRRGCRSASAIRSSARQSRLRQVGGRRGSTRSSIVAAGDNRLTTFNGISGLAKVGLRDMDAQSRQITGEITSSIGQAVKISSIC